MKPKVLVAADNPSFIRKKGELTALLKTLDKVSEDAVKTLITIMTKDNQTDKIKMECAKLLISFNIETAKAVNQDQMTRMIAEIKINKRNSTPLIEEDDTPYIDFDNVDEEFTS